ncbi:hypothetical protein BGY98DRAFT_1178343 [Russula aff. rugulosa BPL654]|nr:hypothetical protein BGY98DRAFT_1178343 [Russula aff. rugulosa BPL654]
MTLLPTSEKVMEADTLLNKASLKVEEFRDSLGQDSYEMAQGSKEVKAGLENKDVLGRYKQAQEYLRKAKETYQAIMDPCECRWTYELCGYERAGFTDTYCIFIFKAQNSEAAIFCYFLYPSWGKN